MNSNYRFQHGRLLDLSLNSDSAAVSVGRGTGVSSAGSVNASSVISGAGLSGAFVFGRR